MGDGPELLHYQEHLQILVGVVLLPRVAVPQLQRPLLHKQDSGPQLAELEVTVVFAEVVYALLGEEGFDVKEAIAERDERDVFEHEQLHGAHILLRELFFKVGSCLKEQLDQGSYLLLL